MSKKVSLTEKEMQIMQDTDFLLTRRRINVKINHLLLQCEGKLKEFIHTTPINFPEGTQYHAGKIARGENYRKLPYYILDYPRLFSRSSIFSLRTMFWWGHYFVVTLHLSGKALEQLRPALLQSVSQLILSDLRIYKNQHDPWQHHHSEENYRCLDTYEKPDLREIISTQEHVKLSRTLSLEDWNILPDFTLNFFKQMLTLISLHEESK